MARRIRWLLAFFLRAEPRRPARGGWALAFDVTVAAAAAAAAAWEVHRALARAGVQHGPRSSAIGVLVPHPAHAGFAVLAVAAMTALPLAFRRYYPISVWLVIATAILLAHAVYAVPKIALGTAIFAAYSAIAHSRYRNLAIVAVAMMTIAVAAAVSDELPRFPSWLTPVFAVLLAAVAGLGIRELRRRLADSAGKLRRADAEARAATESALAAERSRIAAELHDVVTHNVSVMIVQAGAARKILSLSPADAEDALLAAEATGREAMTELRHLLGLLSPRADGEQADADPAAFTPQPGLDELDTLIGRVSAAGLPGRAAGHRPAPAAPAGSRPGRVPGSAGRTDEHHAARRPGDGDGRDRLGTGPDDHGHRRRRP